MGAPGADARGWTAVRLDDVPAIPWRGTGLRWRPMRTALGTRIVGMAAYTAERAGEEVVEDHVETRDGRAVLDELRSERPGSPGLLYGEALLAAAQGDVAGARRWLDDAIAREPRLHGEADNEPMLAAVVRPGGQAPT